MVNMGKKMPHRVIQKKKKVKTICPARYKYKFSIIKNSHC